MKSKRRTIGLLCLMGGLLTGGLRLGAKSTPCDSPLDAKQKQTVVDYVRAKYRLPGTIAFTLEGEARVKDTCFRELTFQGKSPIRTWELKLYASPDLRFLATELLDTSVDPMAEERTKGEALMAGLAQGALAARGPEKAAVTIVEFSTSNAPTVATSRRCSMKFWRMERLPCALSFITCL